MQINRKKGRNQKKTEKYMIKAVRETPKSVIPTYIFYFPF